MKPLPTHHAGRSGAALIAVLAVLTFLTVIVVALTGAMRYESEASHSYKARASAEMMAQEGVEFVKAAATTYTLGTNHWASAPGQLYYTPAGGTTLTAFPLISVGAGAITNVNTVYKAYDLNRSVVSQDGLRAITGTSSNANDSMYAGWIYVHQSGLHETNQIPTLTAQDPIIGRFAYWADDESSRIDLNTAAGLAGNTNSDNHPSRISLTNLFGVNDATLISTNATNNPFASPDDPSRLSPAIAAVIATNRYNLTHYTFSPALNPFGQPKIVLTTHASLTNGTGSTNFIDILNNSTNDPGLVANLNLTKVATQLTQISTLLSSNLPSFGNTSITNKYISAEPDWPRQFALDLIEYVRSAESANTMVEPLRGDVSGGAFNTSLNGATAIMGAARHPMITQIGIWTDPAPIMAPIGIGASPPQVLCFKVTLQVEVYLPSNYGVPSISMVGRILQPQGGNANATDQFFPIPGPQLITLDSTTVSPTTLSAGQFVVITASGNIPTTLIPAPGGKMPIRLSLKDTSTSGYLLWDLVPMAFNVPASLLKVPVSTGAMGNYLEVSDPRVNKFAGDWKTAFGNFGGKPASWSTAVTATPPQDNTPGSDDSLYMPPPKGAQGNTNGLVSSVAELGHITTGIACNTAGIPWRTLRLQPGSGSPPDWALLDFFQAPITTNNPALYQPITNTVGGRVNINGGLGFVNNTNIGLSRVPALAALFLASTNMTSTNMPANAALIAATNAAYQTPASGGTNYGFAAYASPGQLAEIKGIADGGETSEANLRPVVDLATTQGRVFRVYSVGQSLKQTASTLTVQAEEYREVIVQGLDPLLTGGTSILPTTIFAKPIPQ